MCLSKRERERALRDMGMRQRGSSRKQAHVARATCLSPAYGTGDMSPHTKREKGAKRLWPGAGACGIRHMPTTCIRTGMCLCIGTG